MRCFLALDFESSFYTQLQEITNKFSDDIGNFKRIAPSNMHMTLNFFQDINKEEIKIIKDKIFSQEFSQTNTIFNKLGAFPNIHEPKILFIQTNSEEIKKISKKIDFELRNIYKREKEFIQHITLLRIKDISDIEIFNNIAKNCPKENLITKPISISLYLSEITDLGPIYTLLERKKFK